MGYVMAPVTPFWLGPFKAQGWTFPLSAANDPETHAASHPGSPRLMEASRVAALGVGATPGTDPCSWH